MKLRALTATLAALLLLATGCSSKPDREPQPGTSSTGSASLALNPIDYGGTGVAVATFSDAVPGRKVDLEQKRGEDWVVVATGAQDDQGKVEFASQYSLQPQRLVAHEVTHNGTVYAAQTTGAQQRRDQWALKFDEKFDGSALRSKYWAPRGTGLYMGSRLCSAPYPANLTVKGGSLHGTVREAGAANTRLGQQAEAKAKGVPANQACEHGVWDAAMVSTQRKYHFTYGTVAVRAKFPKEPGVHASAWLQRADDKGVEIDFIETFGPSYGIQHKIHYEGKDGESGRVGDYIKYPAARDPKWWDSYHTYSVEWTAKEYVFRIDGTETFRTSEGVSHSPEFIILSLLASDWELPRIKPAEMPSTFAVDWVQVWQQP